MPHSHARPRTRRPGNRITTLELALLVVMVDAPLVAIWGGLPAVFEYGQVVATPLIYLIGGAVYAAFLIGSFGVTRRVLHQGGWYPVVARGLGGSAGLGVGLLSAGTYMLYMTMFFSLAGNTISALILTSFDVDLPVWVAVIFVVALVSVLATLRLRVAIAVLAVLGVAQFAGVLWFCEAAVSHPAGGLVSFEGLNPGWLVTGSFGMALCFAMSSFAGTEIGPTYVADVHDPQRAIPRATLSALAVKVATVVLAAWALTVATGAQDTVFLAVQGQASDQSLPFLLAILIGIVGPQHALTLTNTTMVLLGIAAIGATLAQLHTAGRQVSALAKDGLLPRGLRGRPGGPPPLVTLLLLVVGTGAFAAVMSVPRDPRPMLLIGVTGAISLALVLTLTSLATTLWLLRSDDTETGFFGWEGRVAAAGLSMVMTAFVFVFGVIQVPPVIYPDNATKARLVVVASVVGVFVVGLLWAAVLKARSPRRFARIGRSLEAGIIGEAPARTPRPEAALVPVTARWWDAGPATVARDPRLPQGGPPRHALPLPEARPQTRPAWSPAEPNPIWAPAEVEVGTGRHAWRPSQTGRHAAPVEPILPRWSPTDVGPAGAQ